VVVAPRERRGDSGRRRTTRTGRGQNVERPGQGGSPKALSVMFGSETYSESKILSGARNKSYSMEFNKIAENFSTQ
jgi:hypothetical protein